MSKRDMVVCPDAKIGQFGQCDKASQCNHAKPHDWRKSSSDCRKPHFCPAYDFKNHACVPCEGEEAQDAGK